MEDTILYMAAFIGLVAVAVATSIIAVKRNGRGVGDLLKQLVIWAGITALLPLSSMAGATLLHPRTEWKNLMDERNRVQNVGYNQNDAEARKKSADEQFRLKKLIDEEQRLFYRAMFWVGFPIGLTALVAGLFLRNVAVGTALAFGGMCTLSTGCYSYWDHMGDGLRFFSLLIVLILLVGIGLMKFGKTAPAPDVTSAPVA